MDKERKQQIEEWVSKGAEWCAVQLWTERKQRKELSKTKRELRDRLWRENARNEVDYQLVKDANESLAKVLMEHGIRPTRLRLTYIDTDCENCPEREEGCYHMWGEDGCSNESEYITEVSFYTYVIQDGFLDGITAEFKEGHYNLLKVVDVRTGEIIGEWDRDEEEETE